MLKKIFICPYFGDLPPWMDQFLDQLPALHEQGYHFLIDTDLEGFKKRVREKLGIEPVIESGTGKVWDYRGMLGLLYEEEIKGYDFWGHTDFDVVFGDVSKWVTDEFLNALDVHSNHDTYVCGCWTLYRNTPEVNNLFTKYPLWKNMIATKHANGWVEQGFSRVLEISGLRYKYTFWQGNPWTDSPNLKFEDGKLYQDGEEIMMFHFRRSKKWPLPLTK